MYIYIYNNIIVNRPQLDVTGAMTTTLQSHWHQDTVATDDGVMLLELDPSGTDPATGKPIPCYGMLFCYDYDRLS